MEHYSERIFEGERSLFASKDVSCGYCIFRDGESPLKESRKVELRNCEFHYKYPLWYCRDVEASDCLFYDNARAGIWYTENVKITDSQFTSPKCFRRCDGVTLENVNFFKADETLWSCRNVKLKNVTAKGDYFLMNSSGIEAYGLSLNGNYSFDGASDVVVRNSKLVTKDAFWNCENVTVYDSYIFGEYIGWNSKNLTFVNCVIESLQGMCYIDKLTMKNCRLIDTTLAFEYSENIDAEIVSGIGSVFNPAGGRIKAESIGTLIIEPSKTDPEKTVIICDNIGSRENAPDWLK